MFLIYGKRSFIVKKYTDHTHACTHCRGLNLEVKIEKFYFHLFYIPFFPTHEKFATIKCGNCGKPYGDMDLETEYEDRTKNPIYLYSGLILVASLILFMVYVNLETQKQKAQYVANPLNGDTYLIRTERNDSTLYYFLRVVSISGDSVYTRHSNFEYRRYTANMDPTDFFVTEEELVYTKGELKKMLDDGEINAVDRD